MSAEPQPAIVKYLIALFPSGLWRFLATAVAPHLKRQGGPVQAWIICFLEKPKPGGVLECLLFAEFLAALLYYNSHSEL